MFKEDKAPLDILLDTYPVCLIKIDSQGLIDNIYYRDMQAFSGFIGVSFSKLVIRAISRNKAQLVNDSYNKCCADRITTKIRCFEYLDKNQNVNYYFVEFQPDVANNTILMLIKNITESVLIEQEFACTTEEFKRITEESDQQLSEMTRAMSDLDMTLMQAQIINRRLEALYQITSIIQGKVEINDIFDKLLDGILRELEYVNASIFLLNELGNELQVKSCRGSHNPTVIPVGEGIVGYAALHRELVHVPDIKTDARYIADSDLEILSEAAIPLLCNDRLIGVLDVQTAPGQLIQPYDLDLLRSLASQIAVTIAHLLYVNEVQKQAITDGLTGLYNYRYFRVVLENEFKRAQRYNRSLTLLMIDIDYFKSFNDNYGHVTGDMVLKKVAELIQQCVREVDYVMRYGGEEMTVILPEICTDKSWDIAERILNTIEKYPFKTANHNVARVTVSIGIADSYSANTDLELIQHADSAMYAAKAANRNCVKSYSRDITYKEETIKQNVI